MITIYIFRKRGIIDMKTLKTKAHDWIISIFEQNSLNDNEKVLMDCPIYFRIDGFADEPKVYILPSNIGLEFGYEATQWNDYMPSPIPGMFKKHLLTWENLQSLKKDEQQEIILNLLLKTINTRKRQYQKCQFCGEKGAIENRFDLNTCYGCASVEFGIIN